MPIIGVDFSGEPSPPMKTLIGIDAPIDLKKEAKKAIIVVNSSRRPNRKAKLVKARQKSN